MKNNKKNTASRFFWIETEAIGIRDHQLSHMQKEQVIKHLRERGFRITKQRKILIEIFMSETYSCCKEVYALALKKDPGIGIATVYRTAEALERVGALKRGSSYQLCRQSGKKCQCCMVELEDGSMVKLEYSFIEKMIKHGLEREGVVKEKEIKGITFVVSEV